MKEPLWDTTKSTSAAVRYIREVHKVNEDGVIPVRATKRRKMMDDYCNGNTAEEEL